MSYAAATDVSAEKSRAEIERTLMRYGASGFMSGWMGDRATVAFAMQNRHIKFVLPLPDRKSKAITHSSRGARTARQIENAYQQAVRQRWRALALVIKAKLEAIDAKISTLENEFMPNIVLPDGRTVGEVMSPQIAIAYDTGNMPPLLGYSGGDQ